YYGCILFEVTLPDTSDNPDFKMVTLKSGKYRANMIILDEGHNMLDPNTYEKFSLPKPNYKDYTHIAVYLDDITYFKKPNRYNKIYALYMSIVLNATNCIE